MHIPCLFISQIAMRVLRDNSTADDSSSTAPLVVMPSAAALIGRPDAGGGSASIYPDSNMVIILAALLCVLICALSINSLLRCVRHCGRSLAMGAAAAPASTIVTRVVVVAAAPASVGGLDKRELKKIPVVEYESGKAGGCVPDTTECAICLGEFVDGEKVRLLPSCQHGFHVSCIDTWLAAHSSCPICRNSLLLHDEDDRGAGEGTVVSGEAT